MFKRAMAYGKLQPTPVGYHLVTFNFVDYHVKDGWKLVPNKFKIDILGMFIPDCVEARTLPCLRCERFGQPTKYLAAYVAKDNRADFGHICRVCYSNYAPTEQALYAPITWVS